MKVNVELYKRLVLLFAEWNNVPPCGSEHLDIIGVSWKELHEERRKVEATGLSYEMLESNYYNTIGENEE
tara:strand:- start:76 stop:285 length:210 start_codon:yes stop_codon:yes gene_type:complete